MKHTWVVVANSTFARIFSVENNHELKELEALDHPEGRLHNRDLVSDRPGRGHESASVTRHSIEPKTSPQMVEFTIFAKKLSDRLNQAKAQNRFDRLYLAANPSFLGLLRQHLTRATEQAIAGEYDKDMTQMLPNDIRKHLPFVL